MPEAPFPDKSHVSSPEPAADESAKSLPDPRALARFRLGVREYSARELQRYLRRKGFTQTVAAEVVGELSEKGLLSDARFSRVIAREQVKRDKGPMAIAHKLRAKGVQVDLRAARALFAEALDGDGGGDERAAILAILEKRYPEALGPSSGEAGDPRSPERRLASQRAYQGLVRRGFSRTLVAELLFRRGSAPGWTPPSMPTDELDEDGEVE